MRELAGDKGVFIRSMASRGNLGGLSRAARDAIRVTDAAGFDRILVETVGAGQSEVDIVRAAYTTVVIEAPGSGDDVQAIKAGILEIADILVVNKADRPGVENTVRGLKNMLELGHPVSRNQIISHHGQSMTAETTTDQYDDNLWLPPVIRTVATEGKGIDEVVAAIESHRTYLTASERMSTLENQHIQVELIDRLREQVLKQVLSTVPDDVFAELVSRVQSRRLDPQTAVNELLAQQAIGVAK
jgi:LAO/AO transport system kinase